MYIPIYVPTWKESGTTHQTIKEKRKEKGIRARGGGGEVGAGGAVVTI